MSKFNFIYAEDLSHREKTVYIYLRDRADASGCVRRSAKSARPAKLSSGSA